MPHSLDSGLNGTCPGCGGAVATGSAYGFCVACLSGHDAANSTVISNPALGGALGNKSVEEPPRCAKCQAFLGRDAIGGFCPGCWFEAGISPSQQTSIPAPEIEGHRLIRELGRGGMGMVWLAEQLMTKRMVAIKYCRDDWFLFGRNASALRLFEREIELAARLVHPNIAQIFAGGEVDGIPYCVMEYVEGANLRDHVKSRSMRHEEIIAVIEKVCAAVHHAHAHDSAIIHRDLKPSNILVNAAGEPKVVDFGLAKAMAEENGQRPNLSRTGERKGTPAYMSPEQASGRPVQAFSDVYSLAVILYELLTDQHPHGSDADGLIPSTVLENTDALMLRVATQDARRPRNANRKIDRVLELVLLKALDRNPQRRYATAGEFGNDLRRWRRGERTEAGGVWTWVRFLSWRWVRHHPILMAATVIVLLFATTGLLLHRESTHQASRMSVAAARSEREKNRRPSSALAHFARALAAQPTSEAAGRESIAQIVHIPESVAPWSRGEAIRHEGRVVQAMFSLDGGHIVTASDDGTARVWDAAMGRPTSVPLQHRGPARCIALSPDRKWLATGSSDQTVQIWDMSTGARNGTPLPHGGSVNSICYSSDGGLLAAAVSGKSVVIWNVKTRETPRTLTGHTGGITSVAFSPDGRHIVTGSDDATARIWDPASGETVGGALSHGGPVTAASFSPDGQRVLTASTDGTARVWNVVDGGRSSIALAHPGGVKLARFSPDGLRVATAGNDSVADLWTIARKATSGDIARIPLAHSSTVTDVNFSSDGSFVVTASQNGDAQVWDIDSGEPIGRPLTHGAAVRFASFSRDGARILTAGDDKTVRVWSWPGVEPVQQTLHHQGPLTRAAFGRDGRKILTACWGGDVQLWDAASGRQTEITLRHSTDVHWAALSPDGDRIVTAARGREAIVWDSKTLQPISRLEHGDWIWSAAFSPDGRLVVTASEDATAQIWDTETGVRLGKPLVHQGGVKRAAFSPDCRWIATASDDGSARIWDARTLEPLAAPFHHINETFGVRCVAFSLDSRFLVTGGSDNNARVWEVATGHERIPPLRHGDGVSSAGFSRDGRLIVTASLDGAVRIWDFSTGELVAPPLRHQDEVWDAGFSPDGRWIVSGSADRTARIWETVPTPGRAPHWVPHFLTTLAGREITERGNERLLSFEERNVARARLLALADDGSEWHRLMRWALETQDTRSISPRGEVSLREYIDREIRWVVEQRGGKEVLPDESSRNRLRGAAQAAQRVDPAHPLIHFALAACEADSVRAEFLYRYGLERLPPDEAICHQAEQILMVLEKPEHAAAAKIRAVGRVGGKPAGVY